MFTERIHTKLDDIVLKSGQTATLLTWKMIFEIDRHRVWSSRHDSNRMENVFVSLITIKQGFYEIKSHVLLRKVTLSTHQHFFECFKLMSISYKLSL